MPTAFRFDLGVPGVLEFRAQLRILHVLEAGQAVRDRSHVSAALHIVLSPQRIHTAAVSPDMSGKQRKIDQRYHVVHGVVMFRNPQRPANLCAFGLRVSVRGPPNYFRWYAAFALDRKSTRLNSSHGY